MRCSVRLAFIKTIGCSKTVQLFDQNCHTSAFQIFSIKEGTGLRRKFIIFCNVCFRNEQLANDRICNCSSSRFGKFCEYEFMTMNTFELTIEYQFYLKRKYQNGSQLWGNIKCVYNFN